MHPKEPPLQPVSQKLTGYRDRLLMHGEQVLLQLPGSREDALVCTTERVLILKTGSFNREKVFQLDYASVSGSNVVSGLILGYFEISAAGMQTQRKKERAEVTDAPNCVAITAKQAPDFQAASSFIAHKVNERRQIPRLASPDIAVPSPVPAVPSEQEAIFATLTRLGALRDAGVLTEDEFTTKKAEMLARL